MLDKFFPKSDFFSSIWHSRVFAFSAHVHQMHREEQNENKYAKNDDIAVVNFNNILHTLFLPISFRQKVTKPNND